MKITQLGSGTPTPSLVRAGSGYLVEVGDDVIVIDHGPGAHHRLLQTGKRAADVTHLFFSHLHYDHCCDYARLLLTRWDQGADLIPELKVYGPAHTQRMTALLFEPDGVFGPDLNARIHHRGSIDIFEKRGGKPPRKWPKPDVTVVKPGATIDGGRWRVTVAESSHVQPYLECFAYRFDTEDGSLCYSGDSGGVCPSVVKLAEGCDVLIHMNHYMSGTEPTAAYRAACGNHLDTAEVARQAGVKTLVLTHMLEQIDQPGVRERILREMMAIYPGDILWGADLMEFTLAGPRVGDME
jgi:ribonuclease Z